MRGWMWWKLRLPGLADTRFISFMTTDLALIARIQQRDATALAELYDRYGTRVFSLAVAIVREEMAAQEVTQDTFIKVWNHPDRYRYDDSKFVAWLLMITRHRAIDHLRREKSRGGLAVSMDDDDFPEMPDLTQDVEAKWRDMRHVLDQLPSEQRDVIVRHVRGMHDCGPRREHPVLVQQPGGGAAVRLQALLVLGRLLGQVDVQRGVGERRGNGLQVGGNNGQLILFNFKQKIFQYGQYSIGINYTADLLQLLKQGR